MEEKSQFTAPQNHIKITEATDNVGLIEKIELKNQADQKVSNVILKYSAMVSNRYYILDSLRIDDKRYSFGYNSANDLPNVPQAYGSDYWGFYNGQSEVTGPISQIYRDPYLNQYLTLPAKMPSAGTFETWNTYIHYLSNR